MGKYNLFLESGYLDFESIVNTANTPFTYIIGARGVGKTYGAFSYCLKNKLKFIYMRRQQIDIDKIVTPTLNPIKSIARDLNRNIEVLPVSKKTYGFFEGTYTDKGDFIPESEPLGIAVALSTVQNLRGFDATDYKVLFYDEFIPETHSRPIKEEFCAFCNAIETIARNRELNGGEPLRVYCCSNSNVLCNPYFVGMGVVHSVYNMTKSGQSVCKFPDLDTTIINLNRSPISEQKRNTSLYRMSRNSTFSNMAIDNSYSVDETRCKMVNFKEYSPECEIGEICIYVHKKSGKYHISATTAGTPLNRYAMTEYDKQAFRADYVGLYLTLKTTREITFDSPVEEQYLLNLFEENT